MPTKKLKRLNVMKTIVVIGKKKFFVSEQFILQGFKEKSQVKANRYAGNSKAVAVPL